MIEAIPMTILNRGTNKLIWADSPQGTFDLRSAYKLAMGLIQLLLSRQVGFGKRKCSQKLKLSFGDVLIIVLELKFVWREEV